MGVSNSYLRPFAENNEFTMEDLSKTDADLERAIQRNLLEHFKHARLNTGMDNWVIENRDGVWLAFNEYELQEELRRADIEFDPAQLNAVAHAHLNSFQDIGITLEIPGSISRSYEDPFFFPVFVKYPEGWKDGIAHTHQRFKELVFRYEMSPAEALDYWVLGNTSEETKSWATARNVNPEAIRKNIRQAESKLEDDDLGASHRNSVIQAVSIEDVPEDKPHDPEADRFYIPTDEQIERWD
ncbi:hypothetical protein [Haloarchaeobius amylolyticus]|uniref:hypothetical protein n=1 Tax=Haloarchaeobius amylolyticus TaxID=1198296 RepID=UPI002270CDDD|nr:hypothetical protein [Haloarchaeobius amylolyticus]